MRLSCCRDDASLALHGYPAPTSQTRSSPRPGSPHSKKLMLAPSEFPQPDPGLQPFRTLSVSKWEARAELTPATSPRPGSPHSKKLMLAPSEFPQPDPGLQPFRTLSVSKWEARAELTPATSPRPGSPHSKKP